MSFERLFLLLSGIHPISDAFRASIEQVIIPLSLPKGHLLLESHRISDRAWFLEEGFAMSYIHGDRGIEVENFWQEGEIILSVKSFSEQIPATENIRLLMASKLIFISYPAVQRLFRDFPEARIIYETVVTKYYERGREYAHQMRNMRARDRYRKLLLDFPRIEQIVTQEYIASYLGITPQSLSRLKRMMRL